MSQIIINYSQLITESEDHLRIGQIEKVLKNLACINHKEIPTKWQRPVSNLYRRCSKPIEALNVLAALIRGEIAKEKATDEDVIEYSLALNDLGLTNEALMRLKNIDDEKQPQALIYQIHCYFAQWQYEDAIPLLKKYLGFSNIEPYKMAIAQLNLLAATNALEKTSEANEIMSQLIPLCEKNQWNRLLANCYEQKAQTLLAQHDLAGARAAIDQAASLALSEKIVDSLYIRKWRATIEAHESGNIRPLEELRVKAAELQHWETLRDIDFHIASVTRSPDLVNRLYYGTPYKPFLKRMGSLEELIAPKFQIGDGQEVVFALKDATINGRQMTKPGSKVHGLLCALHADIYRPARVGTLFSAIFPDEEFDSLSSVNRIHQLMWRTRAWLAKSKMALKIVQDKFQYRCHCLPGFAIIQYREKKQAQSNLDHSLEKAQMTFNELFFSKSDLAKCLQTSNSTTLRILNYGLSKGLIVRNGENSNTIYYFAPKRSA